MSEHTPTPWRVDSRATFRVAAGVDDTVATVGCQSSLAREWDANAAFIVRAVNNHGALVKALERIRDFPYVGTQAAQQMALIAAEAIHAVVGTPPGERT